MYKLLKMCCTLICFKVVHLSCKILKYSLTYTNTKKHYKIIQYVLHIFYSIYMCDAL